MKYICIAIFLFLSFFGKSQINLVHNPSFESHNACPWAWDQVKYANFWSGLDSNALPGGDFCLPDYCAVCDTVLLHGSPSVPWCIMIRYIVFIIIIHEQAMA